MAPHSTKSHSMKRVAWNSTKWLWLVLAICLIGWRVSSRVEQYHAAHVSSGQHAQVTYYDANDRNRATLDVSRSHSRLVAEETDGLFPVASEAPPVQPDYESLWVDRTVLPPGCFDTVSLFSNPPPSLA